MTIAIIVILCILALVTVAKSVTRIHQYQRGLVERFGRFKESLDPGLHFIVPFVDSVAARIDMRESVIDVEPQSVITKDNVTVRVKLRSCIRHDDLTASYTRRMVVK